MASYQAMARTNYFAVRDEEAFRAFVRRFGDDIIMITSSAREAKVSDVPPDRPLFGLVFSEEVGIPTMIYHPETDEEEDIDFAAGLSAHLAPGWVAELREIGSEKMRYLYGRVVAVNADGDQVSLNLNDIRDGAAVLGAHHTHAEY